MPSAGTSIRSPGRISSADSENHYPPSCRSTRRPGSSFLLEGQASSRARRQHTQTGTGKASSADGGQSSSEILALLSSLGSTSARQTTATSVVTSGPWRNNAGSGIADGAGGVMAHRSAYAGSKTGARSPVARRPAGRLLGISINAMKFSPWVSSTPEVFHLRRFVSSGKRR